MTVWSVECMGKWFLIGSVPYHVANLLNLNGLSSCLKGTSSSLSLEKLENSTPIKVFLAL